MRRIQSACLEQTVHFQLKDGVEHDIALRLMWEEYEGYRLRLERRKTRYKILEETIQSDGSLVIRIIKQYNDHNCGNYLD